MYQPMNSQQLSDAMAQRPAPQNAITAADITARIADVYHEKVYDSSGALRMTRCTIELDNGFQVTGESVVIDPLNYIESLGQHYSYQDAFSKLWPYFGFLAREKAMQLRKGVPSAAMNFIAETMVKVQSVVAKTLLPTDGLGVDAAITEVIGLLDNQQIVRAQLAHAGYEVVRREYGWVAKLPGGGYSEQMPSREEALASACNHFWGKK